MSSDIQDDEQDWNSGSGLSDKDKSGRGGGRRGGSGGSGSVRPQQSAPNVTQVGLAVTQAKGVNATVVGRIVGEWKHLTGADLVKALADFGSGIARASAHMVVSWADKGFATVMNFLQAISQTQTAQARAGMLGPHGPRAGSDYG